MDIVFFAEHFSKELMKHLLITLFLFTITAAAAQNTGTITGIVLDKEVHNEPLPYASVSIKGTAIHTSTDLDGIHKLETTPGNYTLVINFPGYQKIEVPNVLVRKDQMTKVKVISLAALKLPLGEETSDKEVTSKLK